MIEIPGYAIQGELGRGAMGVVVEALQLETGRRVAIKLIQSKLPRADLLARFEREARTLTSLRHPHILEILDAGCQDGTRYLVLEFLEGQDLKSYVEERLRRDGSPPDEDEALSLLGPIAGALAYLHERGVLHRDVKPENIFISRSGSGLKPVLVDFGLVRSEASIDESRALTGAGEIIGTPAWMAPEQLSPGGSFGEPGPHSEVWAWAGTLYFTLTGQPPFTGQTMIDFFQAITSGVKPDLASAQPEVSPWLIEICSGAFELLPAKRPSMLELCQVIQRKSKREAPRRSNWTRIMALAGLPVLVILLLGVGWILSNEELKLIESGDWPEETAEAQIQLRFRVNQAGALLRINGKELVSGPEGKIKTELSLEEGRQELKLEGSEGGQWKLLKKINIRCDTRAPVVEIQNEAIGERGYLVDGNRVLNLRIQDSSQPVTVFLDNKIREAAFQGHELQLQFTESAASIRIVDRLGNSWQEWIEVIDPAASSRALEFLSSIERWNSTSERIQDRVVEYVREKLREVCRYLGSETYRCGGAATRIARFSHVKTGIELHLVPGGRIKVPRYLSVNDLYQAAMLEAVAEEDSSDEILADLMYDGDFRDGHSFRNSVSMPHTLNWSTGLAEIRRRGNSGEIRRRYQELLQKFYKERLVAREEVIVSPMLISATEVSEACYSRVEGSASQSNLPKRNVSPEGLKAWFKSAGGDLRLPTWIEWRHCCRAGIKARYYWGEESSRLATEVWSYDNRKDFGPKPIDEHRGLGNAFGLTDCLGNVSEWASIDFEAWIGCFKRVIPKSDAERVSQLREAIKVLNERNMALRMGSVSDWWAGWARCDMVHPANTGHSSNSAGFRVAIGLEK